MSLKKTETIGIHIWYLIAFEALTFVLLIKVVAPTLCSIPVLAPEERFWCPFFVKDYINYEAGELFQQKLLEMIQVTPASYITNWKRSP